MDQVRQQREKQIVIYPGKRVPDATGPSLGTSLGRPPPPPEFSLGGDSFFLARARSDPLGGGDVGEVDLSTKET